MKDLLVKRFAEVLTSIEKEDYQQALTDLQPAVILIQAHAVIKKTTEDLTNDNKVSNS